MAEIYNRPLTLDKIDYVIWGTGNPGWGDPRTVCSRMFSKHIVWLCHKKPMSASEIAEELNVPTVYVEEELEILRKGENGEYGFLRRLDNGKYAINFILLDKDVIEKANALYTEQLPKICDIISNYIEEHKAEYLAFPYLNKKVDMNLILWQQVSNISWAFSENVERILKEKYFSDVADVKRPFSVFGYVDNGKYYGGGWDGVDAQNVCGFSNVHLDNIYITRIKKHFSCGLNVSKDPRYSLLFVLSKVLISLHYLNRKRNMQQKQLSAGICIVTEICYIRRFLYVLFLIETIYSKLVTTCRMDILMQMQRSLQQRLQNLSKNRFLNISMVSGSLRTPSQICRFSMPLWRCLLIKAFLPLRKMVLAQKVAG